MIFFIGIHSHRRPMRPTLDRGAVVILALFIIGCMCAGSAGSSKGPEALGWAVAAGGFFIVCASWIVVEYGFRQIARVIRDNKSENT